MIAVRLSAFEESGCINCGCESCRSDRVDCSEGFGVICNECKTHFFVVFDNVKELSVKYAFPKGENGELIYEDVVLQEHPRKLKR